MKTKYDKPIIEITMIKETNIIVTSNGKLQDEESYEINLGISGGSWNDIF